MVERRDFLRTGGVVGGIAALGGRPLAGDEPWVLTDTRMTPVQEDLYQELLGMPVDDTHTHPMTFADDALTSDGFLERMALSSFPMSRYFPDGVYGQWQTGDADARARLDAEHGISPIRDDVLRHARETIFIKGLVKELARFLGSEPTLDAVLEARAARTRADYAGYVRELFGAANVENAMLDMGYREGLDRAGVERFEAAIAPTRSWRILRVDTIQSELWAASEDEDLGFDELLSRFDARLADGLDGTGNLGARSYGMKSYLLPRLGLLKPEWDAGRAAASWNAFRERRAAGALPRPDGVDRDEHWQIQSSVLRFLHSRALEACLERDMPMQFHAGDGEAPRGIMRHQDPFLMEEMIRLERGGVMRYPKVILIHAGYPLGGRASWISHLYGNCYFELSLVTPLVHQGLVRVYLEAMESVPLTKILFGTDAYHLPEFNWLGALWGRRFLARALATYVEGGLLGRDEAIEAARRILHQNNRDVYGL
ncbi:MAG: amidohydrolase family protein [Gemmatimonadota bacterium]|nr:amidohydrolase family protein [Gemmatimonadota bacterium]